MNLFRSEEHVTAWLGTRPPGVTVPVTTLSALAHAWWGDRLSPRWTPHSREHNQAVLDGVGLTGEFWRLG
ncbi:hypothetical protein [Geodermatophilus sp. SYSU D00766]